MVRLKTGEKFHPVRLKHPEKKFGKRFFAGNKSGVDIKKSLGGLYHG